MFEIKPGTDSRCRLFCICPKGISFLESRQARALGIGSGVLVLEVPDGSPAARAGLKGTRRTEAGLVEIGDIISKVDGQIINTESDLFQALEDRKPGDVVELTVSRVTAAEDGLRIVEVVLKVPLQSSADLEKYMSSFQGSGGGSSIVPSQ